MTSPDSRPEPQTLLLSRREFMDLVAAVVPAVLMRARNQEARAEQPHLAVAKLLLKERRESTPALAVMKVETCNEQADTITSSRANTYAIEFYPAAEWRQPRIVTDPTNYNVNREIFYGYGDAVVDYKSVPQSTTDIPASATGAPVLAIYGSSTFPDQEVKIALSFNTTTTCNGKAPNPTPTPTPTPTVAPTTTATPEPTVGHIIFLPQIER